MDLLTEHWRRLMSGATAAWGRRPRGRWLDGGRTERTSPNLRGKPPCSSCIPRAAGGFGKVLWRSASRGSWPTKAWATITWSVSASGTWMRTDGWSFSRRSFLGLERQLSAHLKKPWVPPESWLFSKLKGFLCSQFEFFSQSCVLSVQKRKSFRTDGLAEISKKLFSTSESHRDRKKKTRWNEDFELERWIMAKISKLNCRFKRIKNVESTSLASCLC